MVKRTIRRRVRKNKTIRKVMRGCNRRRMKEGGANIQVHQYSGASPDANKNIQTGTQHLLQAQQNARNTPPPIPSPRASSMAGGARTRHHKRRLRYKKSMARKSRHA
jgi:hypothetical protein